MPCNCGSGNRGQVNQNIFFDNTPADVFSKTRTFKPSASMINNKKYIFDVQSKNNKSLAKNFHI